MPQRRKWGSVRWNPQRGDGKELRRRFAESIYKSKSPF